MRRRPPSTSSPSTPLPVNPFEDLEDLVRNNYQPDIPVTMLDPNAPSLASGTVAWYAPGDLTPSF